MKFVSFSKGCGTQGARYRNAERLAYVKKLIERGLSVAHIAQQVGISRTLLYHWLHKLDLEPPGHTRALTPTNAQSVVRQYKAGQSCRSIAKRFRVSPNVTVQAVREAGQKIRPRQIHKIDKTAFDRLSPSAAYWIGFLMADGHIRDDGCTIDLALAAKDGHHVACFKRFLQTTYPLLRRGCSGGLGGPQIRLVARSRQLVAALHRYGVTPRKTFTAKASKKLVNNRHFWRGLIDGDGSIVVTRRWRSLSLTGSAELMRQFCEFVAKTIKAKVTPHPRKSVWGVSLGERSAAALAKLLYSGARVALRRKARLARQLLRWAQRNPLQTRRTHRVKGSVTLCGLRVNNGKTLTGRYVQRSSWPTCRKCRTAASWERSRPVVPR